MSDTAFSGFIFFIYGTFPNHNHELLKQKILSKGGKPVMSFIKSLTHIILPQELIEKNDGDNKLINYKRVAKERNVVVVNEKFLFEADDENENENNKKKRKNSVIDNKESESNEENEVDNKKFKRGGKAKAIKASIQNDNVLATIAQLTNAAAALASDEPEVKVEKRASSRGRKAVKKEEEEEEIIVADEPEVKVEKRTSSRGKKAVKKEEDIKVVDEPAEVGKKSSSRGRKAVKKEDDEEDIKVSTPVVSTPLPEKKETKVIRKGNAVVDQDCPIKNNVHVFEENGVIYDALLNQNDLANNHNKYYIIQVLQSDSNLSEFYCWTHWGRVGKTAGDDNKRCSSKDDAIAAFKKKFNDKTGNHWENRDNFEPKNHKYILLFRDYLSKDEKENKAPRVKKENSSAIVESKLDPRLGDLISTICDVQMINHAMAELTFDINRLPLGKLTQDVIKKGFTVLKEIDEALKSNAANRELQRLSSLFYTYIPHECGMRVLPTINSRALLESKISMIEQLSEVEIATAFFDKADDEDPLHPIDSRYHNLNCGLTPLDMKGEVVKMIQSYITNTHGTTHNNYTIELLDVFEIDRKDEKEKFRSFENLHNRQLLWHGSRLTNYVGILSQGLRIAPPEAPVTGYMFGKGVYFADCVSKSANYCFTSGSNNVGCMLLCDVALGNCNEKLQSDYNANLLPAGKHSTKGVGINQPNESNYIIHDGITVPLGKVETKTIHGSALQYNEFIVYDTAQIRMKYLLKVKFNYKRGY